MKTVQLDLDNSLRTKLRNSPSSLTADEKERVRAEVAAAIKRIDDIDQMIRQENPFWYYQPVTGEISTERREFLHKHLKHEDVPQTLQGPLAMHLSDKPIRVASGGNQSSKSFGMVMELIMMATGKLPFCFDPNSRWFKWRLPEKRYKREKPQNVRVVGFDWENDVVKNLLPKFRDLSPKECLQNGSFDKSYVAGESTLHYTEKGKTLGSVEFMSNKQDLASFGGPPRDAVGFDEEPFHEVYKENLMRMTTAKNFEVLMASTPVNGISWAYDELYSKWLAGDENIDYFQYCSVANPYANLDSLVQILNGLSYEEKKMRLLGEFISLSGLVYGRLFDKSVHVIEPFQTGCTCKENASHDEGCPFTNFLGYLGVDPHMVKDSTAALCFIDREDNFYVDTCYKGADNIDQFRENIKNLLIGKRMAWSVFDPSSDSTITAFNGLNIFKLCTRNPNPFPRARKGEKYHGSIAAGVQTIKQRLEINEKSKKPKFFIMNRPENQLLIKSMKTLQRDSFNNEEVMGQKDKIQEGIHDHHACVRYIMQNKLNWRNHQEYAPAFQIPDEDAMLL